jgi:hypothetical protein
MAKHDIEVDELRMVQNVKNEKRDAKVQELMDHRESDFEKYDAELGVWHAPDRKIHAGLQGLEDASLVRPFFRFSAFVPLCYFPS